MKYRIFAEMTMTIQTPARVFSQWRCQMIFITEKKNSIYYRDIRGESLFCLITHTNRLKNIFIDEETKKIKSWAKPNNFFCGFSPQCFRFIHLFLHASTYIHNLKLGKYLYETSLFHSETANSFKVEPSRFILKQSKSDSSFNLILNHFCFGVQI